MKFFFALCCFLTTAMILPGLAAGEWLTDFEKAKAESLKTGRPIFILFTNSDAAPDRNLDRAIFSQRKFQEYADKNLVLMKVDFPVAIHLQSRALAKQNSDLRAEHGITILPTVLLLDANGKLYVDFIKADGSMEKHRRKINEIMDFNAPKRYADYLDVFVKKYTPPKPEVKEPEAKVEAKKTTTKKTTTKKTDKKTADTQQKVVAETQTNAETNIPDENAGTPLIPLVPEGDLQAWLNSQTEETVEETKETVEETKETVEETKETVEEVKVEAEETVEEKTDAVKEEAEPKADSAEK